MTDLRKAAEKIVDVWFRKDGINYVDFKPYMEELRQALAQPEEEPETVMEEYKFQTYAAYKTDGEIKIGVVPEQRPVGTYEGVMEAMLSLKKGTLEQQQVYTHMKDKLLYTAPPKREWVGLTDEDLKPLCDEWRIMYGGYVDDFAKSIEAKLKEKNT